MPYCVARAWRDTAVALRVIHFHADTRFHRNDFKSVTSLRRSSIRMNSEVVPTRSSDISYTSELIDPFHRRIEPGGLTVNSATHSI